MKTRLVRYIAAMAITAGLVGILVGTVGQENKTFIRPHTVAEAAKTAVMITNMERSSGGTGVILRSGRQSLILTNKHVCELIQVGGLVRSQYAEVKVYQYKIYPSHDLCLIKVNVNLEINTILAKEEPTIFSEARVSGHPALLPLIQSTGHFSEKETIQVMVGTKPCNGEEGPEDAFGCIFTGQKPILKELDAQLVSALIMPGSSGSAVFNSDGELSGLVFAGSQGLSYGFIVPFKYVKAFLSTELAYKWVRPNSKVKPKSFFSDMDSTISNLQKYCTKELCKNPIPAIWFK